MEAIDYDAHPIFDPIEFRINTPPVENLKNKLTRLAWTGACGAALLGYSRAGKSYGIQLVENEIESRAGKRIPVVRYSTHKRDSPGIRSLYENMLTRFCVYYKPHWKTEKLSDSLLTYLAEKARAADVKQLILAVDETQRLTISQIDLFSELLDVLEQEFKIALICLFIGNREQMGRLLKVIEEGENEHIYGRFFNQKFRFYGLKSDQEVEFCLNQYDTLRYPENGPTYTEFFMKDEYEKGFRMASLAESLWDGFIKCKKAMNKPINDWSMDSFVRTVNPLLTDYLSKFGSEAYSQDMLMECIKLSGLYPKLDEIKEDI